MTEVANEGGEFITREDDGSADYLDESNDSHFDMACTDLNEEELDLNISSRKMSIRALNVATMNRFSPNYGTVRQPSPTNIFANNKVPIPPKPASKPSMLLRASSVLLKQ